MVDPERRSEERYEIRAAVAVRRSRDPSEVPDSYVSRNISSKGIFLELNGNEGIEAGQKVYLEIDLGRLGEGGQPVQVLTRGTVVRREHDGLAVKFIGKSSFLQN